LDCFNCAFFLAPENPNAKAQIEQWSKEYNIPLEIMHCSGCRSHKGRIPVQMYLYGDSHRFPTYECTKSKGHFLCGDCEDFPCDHLHPSADQADSLPHCKSACNNDPPLAEIGVQN
jgi:hypothetical protein